LLNQLSIRKLTQILMLLLAMIALVCCTENQRNKVAEMGGQLSVLEEMYELLKHDQAEGDVGVHLHNGNVMTVSFLNSEFNHANETRIKAKAEEVVKLVKQFKNSNEELAGVGRLVVQFIKQERKFLIVTYTSTVAIFNFEINTKLDQDHGPCPALDVDLVTGDWQGEKFFEAENLKQIWRHVRRADGTFTITFYVDEGKTIDMIENGTWAIEGCVLTNSIREIGDERVDIEEVYQVNELTNESITYTSLRSGNTYSMVKVSAAPE